MTTLRTRIEADLKAAMLAKDSIAKDALRLLKADLLNKEVELGRELTHEESSSVLQKSVKSRRDAIEQFREGGRLEMVDEEEKQLAILARYMPKQLDEEETRRAVLALKEELGLSGKKDLGKLMKELKARHEGIDGKLASKLAGELLG